ncbi:uncharacterized protein ARMOST_02292 [Armillaria ostoyae]|uniref:Uncharacterized protein n=1 Tax=Armillaria ostoyae TaxID=47428 RepID=A0A284QRJ1_ARMOS|nr:uncharacterized protein ARMOST_02292 [Armillaria ostoyae]
MAIKAIVCSSTSSFGYGNPSKGSEENRNKCVKLGLGARNQCENM